MLAGGIESMSRMPYLVDSDDARWGHKMGNFQLVDAMYRDGFQCPLSDLIMGETAEILARQYGITREESDAFALDSQQKAEAAQTARALRRRDRAGAGDGAKGKPVELAIRRASARRHDDRRPAQAAAGFRQVEGHARHHHGGIVVGHHRRRRRARAGAPSESRRAAA